jgi:hypothetical protein
LQTQAISLRQDSETLNSQLVQARELNRELQRSFDEYEAGQLTLISLKNGEIADLKQTAAAHKGIARIRLIISIALGAAWEVNDGEHFSAPTQEKIFLVPHDF